MAREGTPAKVEAFYHSTEWRKCVKAFKSLKNYTCERCGKPGWIVHHKSPLTPENIDDPEVSLNDAIHHQLNGRGLSEPHHHSVKFDADGNVIVSDKSNTPPGS